MPVIAPRHPARSPLAGAHTLCVLLLLSTAIAQEKPADPPSDTPAAANAPAPASTHGRSRHGDAFDEGPRQAAYLMPGMSSQVRMHVAGLTRETQAIFDQGLCQLHGFWYFESERSFRMVAKLEPDCAMAYLGMALANIENVARAVPFVAEAVRRSADAPRYEQLWIDAYAKYYRIDDAARIELRSGDAERVTKSIAALKKSNEKRDDRRDLHKKLLEDLGTIVYEFPQDVEARARLALETWDLLDWGSQVRSHTGVDVLLDSVFAAAPDHPAHHYRVHLWDTNVGERGLRSAARIGQSAPGIAHQWHMAGHIYAKLHRHGEASWQQEASGRVDHAHMHRDRVMPFLIHNYGHNQEWLSRSLSNQGRIDEALAVAKNLAELPRHPKWSDLDEPDTIASEARARLAMICEEHGLWSTALELVRDGYLEPCDSVQSDLPRLALLARAHFRLLELAEGDAVVAEVKALLPKARAERARKIDEAEDKALASGHDRDRHAKAVEEAAKQSIDVVQAVLGLQDELAAERLLATGDAKGAAEAMAKVEGMPKYMLADVQLAAGDAKAAIEALKDEVKEHPNRLPTLARLVLAYRAANDEANAEALKEREAELAKFPGARGPLAEKLGLPPAREVTIADFGADFGTRPELASLGPVRWQPQEARALALPRADGGTFDLAAQKGKPTLVVFYLGLGCLHCVEQLKALGPKAKAFAELGIDVVAVGTDGAESVAESLAAMKEEERFPFPLLADPEMAAFRAWRCYDDFEEMPLHGTFLVDGQGRVRWQDQSFEPFVELEWLVGESKRLLALPATGGVGAR
ncbi:MAG: redoxin domain-containing protein [Planctomycetota bacterium]